MRFTIEVEKWPKGRWYAQVRGLGVTVTERTRAAAVESATVAARDLIVFQAARGERKTAPTSIIFETIDVLAPDRRLRAGRSAPPGARDRKRPISKAAR